MATNIAATEGKRSRGESSGERGVAATGGIDKTAVAAECAGIVKLHIGSCTAGSAAAAAHRDTVDVIALCYVDCPLAHVTGITAGRRLSGRRIDDHPTERVGTAKPISGLEAEDRIGAVSG